MQATYYKIIGDYLFEEEYGWYHTYGVSAAMPDGKEMTVRDISPDRTQVERFVRQCNECALSPLHLTDAIEDTFY